MPPVLSPVRIDLIGGELAVAWSDGQESFIGLEQLRRQCPCAACKGEPDVLGRGENPRVSYGSGSFELRSYQFVGGYAFQPKWNDGHESGLYPFALLRSLSS